MTTARKRIALILVGLAFSAWFAWLVIDRLRGANTPMALEEAGAAPVEVAPVEHGVIEWRRVFSGTLESPGEFVVAPKISGRI